MASLLIKNIQHIKFCRTKKASFIREVENTIRVIENGPKSLQSKPMKGHMKLGSQLKTYCKQKGWSLTKLSKASSVPVATIHGWVHGRTHPDLSQLKKVAEALEVSPHLLAFGVSDPYEIPADEILKELFTGDLRVSIQKIERKKKT